MPLPESYSEATLAAMMHATLADVAQTLGFTVPDSYEEAIIDVTLALGVADVAAETDLPKLRAFAKVAAWKRALTAAATRYDLADGTQSLKRSQLTSHIQAALALAETETSQYPEALSGYAVTVGRVTYSRDPYVYAIDEDRAL